MGFKIEKSELKEYIAEKKVNDIIIPDGIKKIGNTAFGYCTSPRIIIPDSVEVIDDWAFSQCSNLTEIVLPNSIEKIGKGAFFQCSKLHTLILPDNITDIGNFIINECVSMENIVIRGRKTTIKIKDRDILRVFVMNRDAVRAFDFIKSNLRRMEKILSETEQQTYKICFAVFLLFEYDSVPAGKYVTENISDIVKYLTDIDDAANITNILPYIDKNSIDGLISYAISHKKHEIQVILSTEKNKRFGFKNNFDDFLL